MTDMLLDLDTFFNLKNSLTRFFVFLTFFAGIATFDAYTSEPAVITQLIVLMCLALLAIYWLRAKQKITVLNPLNFLISTLIIHLLIHPTTTFIYPISALFVLTLSKMAKRNGQPIFNPTVLALITTYYVSLLFHKVGLVQDTLLISWWGADMSQAFLDTLPAAQIIVSTFFLVGFIYCALQYRKHILMGMFFMMVMGCVYFANMYVTHTPVATLEFLLASLFNSFAFMTCVMISEPKTSPSFMKQQALVGIVGGLLFYLTTFTFTATPNGFLLTILGMNLLTYGLKQGKLFQN